MPFIAITLRHHSPTLDSQSELQALFKRKAFIPQTKEWVIWKLSVLRPSLLHLSLLFCSWFFYISSLHRDPLLPSLCLCAELSCDESPKVRVAGSPFNFVAADLSLFLCPRAHTFLFTCGRKHCIGLLGIEFHSTLNSVWSWAGNLISKPQFPDLFNASTSPYL